MSWPLGEQVEKSEVVKPVEVQQASMVIELLSEISFYLICPSWLNSS